MSSKKEIPGLRLWDAVRTRQLEEEIRDLERQLAAKQFELLELGGQQEEPIANHVLLGPSGPAYLSDLFCPLVPGLPTDRVPVVSGICCSV